MVLKKINKPILSSGSSVSVSFATLSGQSAALPLWRCRKETRKIKNFSFLARIKNVFAVTERLDLTCSLRLHAAAAAALPSTCRSRLRHIHFFFSPFRPHFLRGNFLFRLWRFGHRFLFEQLFPCCVGTTPGNLNRTNKLCFQYVRWFLLTHVCKCTCYVARENMHFFKSQGTDPSTANSRCE